MTDKASNARSHSLVTGWLAGFITAAFTLVASSSFATLLCAGSLAAYTPAALRLMLITAAVVGGLVAWFSSYQGCIAIPQDRVAPILAVMAADIVRQMPKTSTGDERFITVLAAITLVTLLTGMFLYAMGRWNLGNLVRYVPYPVIGGFLAGSGWLLVAGAFRVLLGESPSIASLSHAIEPAMLARWAPGILLGFSLLLAVRRKWPPYLLPVLLLGAIAVFHILLPLTGLTLAHARSLGWLPEIAPPITGIPVSGLQALREANWLAIAGEYGLVGTVLVTSVVSILLTASALELAAEQEIDLNRELRVTGLANLLASTGGGMVGFHSLSLSRLVLSLGANRRSVGLISAALCGLTLFTGASLLTLLPRWVPGGLLFFLGISFLAEWVIDARRKLTRLDYSVVVLILIVIGTLGYWEGVCAGVAAAIGLFIHNYSRVNVVTQTTNAADHPSHVDRPPAHHRLLREQGARAHVLRLQGFIFFGTANRLLADVRLRLEDPAAPPLRFLLLDFQRVTGIDSSAVLSLLKIQQFARQRRFDLVFTHVSTEIRDQLEPGGLKEGEAGVRYFPDLDHGIEWCEDMLLNEAKAEGAIEARPLREQLASDWPDPLLLDKLLAVLERRELPAGQTLIRQQESPSSLYFLETGQLTVQLQVREGHTVRLRKMGAGTVVGEVGLYLGGPRTASVLTESPCMIYCLTAEALQELERDQPEVAAAFHRFMVRRLAERLAMASQILGSVAG